VQIVDALTHQVTDTLTPGKGVLHMEFTPRGREVWLSVRDENRVEIRDARTREVLAEIPAKAPSGIFFTDRAHRTGLVMMDDLDLRLLERLPARPAAGAAALCRMAARLGTPRPR
jgi:hypothetical protein